MSSKINVALDRNNPVRHFMDCSTGHLAEAEGTRLRELADMHDAPTIARWFPEGAWIWVPEDAHEFAVRDWTKWPTLLDVLLKARSLECDWVLFDADAGHVDGLQRYEW